MESNLKNKYHLFASCIAVNGSRRSAVYDLQRYAFEYIPNSLFEILENRKDISFFELLNEVDDQNDRLALLEYFDFLVSNEFIFFSDLPSLCFPKLDEKYIEPYNISLLIVDMFNIKLNDLTILKEKIIELKVKCIILRYKNVNFDTLIRDLSLLNDIPTRTIQVFLDVKSPILDEEFEKIISLNQRLSIIVRYNSVISSFLDIKKGSVFDISRNILESKTEIKDISDFDLNANMYFESKSFNTFYNRRMYINSIGEIFRHEFDDISFGSIMTSSLLDIVKKDFFQKYWNVKKDDIVICKDCEYRYMCVDSRLPLYKNDENLWVLEGNCNYDPYTASWK